LVEEVEVGGLMVLRCHLTAEVLYRVFETSQLA